MRTMKCPRPTRCIQWLIGACLSLISALAFTATPDQAELTPSALERLQPCRESTAASGEGAPFDARTCEMLIDDAELGDRAQALLAFGYARAGDASAAAAYAEQVQLQTSTEWQVLNDLGAARLYLSQFQLAVAHLEQALSYAPDQPAIRANLVLALRGAGRFGEARYHFAVLQGATPEPSTATQYSDAPVAAQRPDQ